MTAVGVDVSSRGIAFCLRLDDKNPELTFVPFEEDEESEEDSKVMQRLQAVRDAINGYLGHRTHLGELSFRLELPSLNATNAGTARASTVAIAFTYAAWGILVASNRHKARIVHNATWKRELRERFKTAAISSKDDVREAVQGVMPLVAAYIVNTFPKGQQQDIFDAVGIAYGPEQ